MFFQRVVAVDMRGYGDSDKPKSMSAYKREMLVEDMREFIEQLGEFESFIFLNFIWLYMNKSNNTRLMWFKN